MKIVQPVMEHVEARNPIISFDPTPPLPEEPSIEEQRALQVDLRTEARSAANKLAPLVCTELASF